MINLEVIKDQLKKKEIELKELRKVLASNERDAEFKEFVSLDSFDFSSVATETFAKRLVLSKRELLDRLRVNKRGVHKKYVHYVIDLLKLDYKVYRIGSKIKKGVAIYVAE